MLLIYSLQVPKQSSSGLQPSNGYVFVFVEHVPSGKNPYLECLNSHHSEYQISHPSSSIVSVVETSDAFPQRPKDNKQCHHHASHGYYKTLPLFQKSQTSSSGWLLFFLKPFRAHPMMFFLMSCLLFYKFCYL